MTDVLIVDLSDPRLTSIEQQVLSIIAARLQDSTIRVSPHMTPLAILERCRRALIRSR